MTEGTALDLEACEAALERHGAPSAIKIYYRALIAEVRRLSTPDAAVELLTDLGFTVSYGASTPSEPAPTSKHPSVCAGGRGTKEET